MATLTGTAGPDVLTGGLADDLISGLAGDDTLDGVSGADTLYGGDGNDLLILSAAAATAATGLVDGGAGTDTLDLSHLASPLLTVSVPAPGLEFQVGGETFDVANVETFVFGDGGSNVSFAGYAIPVAVYGGAGRDIITGSGGNDSLFGGGGDDFISSGSGTDYVEGGDGNDRILASVAETIYGGAGDDAVFLASATTTSLKTGILDGGTGHNLLQIGTGFDLDLELGGGVGGFSQFKVFNFQDVSVATGAAGTTEQVLGTEDANVIGVTPGAEGGGAVMLDGRGGDDSLTGGVASDTLTGGAGSDTLVGGAGSNSLDGGAGDDTAVLANAYADSTVSYVAGTIVVSGPHGIDTLSGIEHVSFSDGSFDVGSDGRLILTPGLILNGTAAGDALTGAAGDDTLSGGDGNDTLTGGPGSDSLDGGAGSDVATYAHPSGDYLVRMDMALGTVAGGPDNATDHLASVETVSFLDGTLNFDPDSAAAQVYRLYDAAFGRAPDFYGEASWADQLEHGLSLQRLAVLFSSSAEFQAHYGNVSDDQFVREVYETVLHREADPGGLQTWTGYLDSGTITRAQLITLFSEGDEHRALTADAIGHGVWTPDPIYEDVEFVYQAAFGRAADEGGLAHWATEIEAGRLDFHALAVTATQSQEFLDATKGLNHGQLVDYLYETALGRPADPGGHAAFTAALDAGHSVAEIVQAFAQSDELHSLVEPRLENADWFVS